MFSVSLIAFLASAGFAAAQATCSRSYTVQEGDYCDAISAANNASTYQLAVSNYQTVNEACTNLAVGQNLCLGNVGQDCTTTYVVQDGDYCDMIASNHQINSTLLMTNNPQIDDNCWNLYIGEVLCVASDLLVTPAPEGWVLPGSTLDDGDDTENDSATVEDPTTEDPATDDTTEDPAPTQDEIISVTSSAAPAATTSKAPTKDDTSKNSSKNDDKDADEEEEDDSDLPDCDDE